MYNYRQEMGFQSGEYISNGVLTSECSNDPNRLCPKGYYCNSRYVAYDAGYALDPTTLN